MSSVVERVTLEFQAGTGPGLIALAVLGLVILIVLGARATAGAPERRRRVLIALRVAQAVAIMLLVMQPALRRESVAVSAAPVAVIVDASGSMSVRERAAGADGSTRLLSAARWLKAREAEIDELEAATAVEWYATSSGTLRAITREEAEAGGLAASGDTDLAGSLRALGERHPGRPRPGVLLLSDGADFGAIGRAFDEGRDLAAFIPPGGPVVTVAPEGTGLADRAVEVIARDPVGFLRTDITVRVRVRSTGLGEEDVPVTLAQGGSILQVRTVRVGGAAGDAAELTLQLRASRVGESVHSVSVAVAAGEAVTANNQHDFSVRVVRDRLRVLQIAGRPSWDGRFLREILKRDPAVDLISFFILRTQWDDPLADVDDLSLIPFPIRELFDEKLEGFDLIIFQNFGFAPHAIEPYLDVLARHVRGNGAGLLVVGGDLGLGSDWSGPDVGPLLPVSVTGMRWNPREQRVSVTEVGARHPALRLAADAADVQSLVRDLLPVAGVNEGLTPTAGARVLLRTAPPSSQPVLVAGEAGEGRVLVLATDGSWRWSLPMAERPGGARTYEAFWQAAFRWLVRDERSAMVVLEAERREIAPGEQVELRAFVRGDGYEPVRGEPVTIVVRDASGTVVLERKVETGDDGAARVPFEAGAPGPQAVTALTARGSAGPLHVECVDRSREMRDVAARPGLLAALARAGGGEVLALDQPSRGRLPFRAEREERVESTRITPLWRSWPAWALVAGLLCVEWWLRRRQGLA